jgi:general secretion pathway protein G
MKRTSPRPLASRMPGFTLVELLVVVAIVSALATIGLPLAELAQRRTQEEELKQSLRVIRKALDDYKDAVAEGRILRNVGDSGYPPNLNILVDGVPDAKSPRGEKLYFLRRLPRDPFAPADITQATDTWGLRSYVSPADAPQPGKDVYDVYSRSKEKGLNGAPFRNW